MKLPRQGRMRAAFVMLIAFVLQSIPLPVRCPTMPAFGGPDLRTLYITTARTGLSAAELTAQPLAGALFSVRLSQPGRLAHRYAG